MPLEEDLRKKAFEAQSRAYAPYSHFPVGACLLAEDGSFFTGCNVENASFGGTVCAERVAIYHMVVGGGRRFSTLYVYSESASLPCGLCLQVMGEFAPREARVITGDGTGSKRVITLGELLPVPFSFSKDT